MPIPMFIQNWVYPQSCSLIVAQYYTLMSPRALQSIHEHEPLPPVKIYNTRTKEEFLANINITHRDASSSYFTINFMVKQKLKI